MPEIIHHDNTELDVSDVPELCPPTQPVQWLRICDYLQEHIDVYPLSMAVRVLRGIRATLDDHWEDDEVILHPCSMVIQKQLETILPLLQEAANQCFDSRKEKSVGIKIACLETNDAVHHPEHYTKGAVECIEAIRASMTVAAYRGYLKGNALKYIWRYEEKGGVESLEKAQVYLGWLIENIRGGA